MHRSILLIAAAILLVLGGCSKAEKAEQKAAAAEKVEYADTVAPPQPPPPQPQEKAVSKSLQAKPTQAMAKEKAVASKAQARPKLPARIISDRDSAEMVLVPGGPFIYGLNKRSRDKVLDVLSTAHLAIFNLEYDSQMVDLPSYYIDKYEVTNAQYKAFIKETGHRRPKYSTARLYNSDKQPVVGIGWDDAQAYAAWAGKRLPTEEEWEKAARGTDGRMWPWGNDPSSDNYNGSAQGNYAPVEVGSFPQGASPYGAMDMAGNVYEMTTGIWGRDGRAMRGGSYLNAGAYTRTMFRWAPDNDTTGAAWLGFRCVMDTSVAGTLARPALRRD